MAYSLPKSGRNLERETSAGGGVPLRQPKGVQVAAIDQEGRKVLDGLLNTKLSELAKKTGDTVPWPFGGWTLREGLQSGMTRSKILERFMPELQKNGVTLKELDDAVAGKPLPAAAPKPAEKPVQAAPPVQAPTPAPAPKPAPVPAAAPPQAAPPAQAAPAPAPPAPIPAAAPAAAPAAVPPPSPATGGGGAVPNRMAAYKHAIAGIESAGRYGALGTRLANGDQALGKYQIMESNLPRWSKDALGRAVTRDEFLKNPDLQEKIFEHRFGGYVKNYGEEGAARAWYAGEKGMKNLGATDIHGKLTVADYGKNFLKAADSYKGDAAPTGAPAAVPQVPRPYVGMPSEDDIKGPPQPAPTMPRPYEGMPSEDDIKGDPTVPAPVPDTGGGGAPAVADAAPAKGFDWQKGIEGFGDSLSDFGKNMAPRADTAKTPANVPMAPISPPSGPVPMIDPRVADMHRQQLAMALQRLNSGKLYG